MEFGREVIVRRLAFPAQFKGWPGRVPDADLRGQGNSPDASFGAGARSRRRDPRDEQARQEPEDREDVVAFHAVGTT